MSAKIQKRDLQIRSEWRQVWEDGRSRVPEDVMPALKLVGEKLGIQPQSVRVSLLKCREAPYPIGHLRSRVFRKKKAAGKGGSFLAALRVRENPVFAPVLGPGKLAAAEVRRELEEATGYKLTGNQIDGTYGMVMQLRGEIAVLGEQLEKKRDQLRAAVIELTALIES